MRSKADDIASLVYNARHRNEKNKEKPSSSEEPVRGKVRGCSPRRSETTGTGFVKQVGFEPGLKVRESYG